MANNLEGIVKETDYWKDVWEETKRVIYIPWAVYWKGLKYREEQQKAAEYLGWQEKTITLSNAIICGFATSALYYWSGGESRDFFANSSLLEPVKDYIILVGNVKDQVISGIANFLGISTRAFLYSWSVFNTVQTSFRIYYAQKNKKAMPSISLWGALANAKHVYKTFSNKERREALMRNLLN